MTPHADGGPRRPEDFLPVLSTAEPLLIVGGQAVNLWALYYIDRTSGMEPFVSRDLDVLGSRETLELLAELAGAKPQFFPRRPPSNEIGVLIAADRAGNPMLIEVLGSVRGVTNEELRESVFTVTVGGSKVHIPSPIVLLQAKIANVAELDQTNRQDVRHLRILARLMPSHLADLIAASASGRMTERSVVDSLEQLLRTVTSATAEKVFVEISLSRLELFAGLENVELPKVRSFAGKRLSGVLGL